MHLKLSILGLGLLSAAQCVFAGTETESIRLIVKYKHQPLNVTALKSHVSQFTHLPVKQVNPMANGAYSVILKKPVGVKSEDAIETVLHSLRNNPEVLYAVKDRVGYFKPVPDPVLTPLDKILSHHSQWDEFTRPAGVMLESEPGLKDGAWAITTGKSSSPVVVAVLDTGVALNDSLINSLVKDDSGQVIGWNFAGNNSDISDETLSYHGTHVSGTIAGYGDVMTGMGEDLKILTLKIPDHTGMFYESAVINAMYWSVGGDVPGIPQNHFPAKVLNMSFGVDEGPGKEIDHCDEALQEAVFFVHKKGAVLVAAAGNDNVWEHFNAPAVCNGTMKIASTGPEGLRSYFSNYGPSVTLAAPGGDKRYGAKGGILSTVNPGGGFNGSGFDFYQGTSMASPHVAGVAGLVFAASAANLKPEQVEQILYITTHDFGVSVDSNKSCVGKKPCGHGILDAENAVKAAVANYDVLITAPIIQKEASDSCPKGTFKPVVVPNQGAEWNLKHSVCQSEADYLHPYVQKSADGLIYAYFGKVAYELNHSGYASCDVIGYNGVGCFN